jgi:hypothetical protein
MTVLTPVFIPPLNTLSRKDLDKNILDSIENGDGVKVLSDFGRGSRINFQEENDQEEKEL